MNTNQKGGMAASYASGGQYGFSDKVVDGITLTVNSVLLTLKSRAFIASFQVSQSFPNQGWYIQLLKFDYKRLL